MIQVAGDYLRALCWGIPAICAFIFLRMFNKGLSITSQNIYFKLIGLGINIARTYAIMFGHSGFPTIAPVGAE